MLGYQDPAQLSPAIGNALNARYLYLEVRCFGRDTHQTVTLNIVRRPKASPSPPAALQMFDQVEVTPYRTIVSKSRSPGSNGITRATAERTFIVP
jgi:hypothetical protein